VSGLNLHYLTYPVYRALLYNWAGNKSFNYLIIKNEPLIKAAFRSYKLDNIVNPKKIDWKSILAMLSVIRNYSPQELMKIREAVDQQVLSRQPEILNEIFGNIYAAMQNQQENI
jgi:hypothetical protein